MPFTRFGPLMSRRGMILRYITFPTLHYSEPAHLCPQLPGNLPAIPVSPAKAPSRDSRRRVPRPPAAVPPPSSLQAPHSVLPAKETHELSNVAGPFFRGPARGALDIATDPDKNTPEFLGPRRTA